MSLAALAAALAFLVPAAPCPHQAVSPAYAAQVRHVLASGRDVWGEELLRSPAGPTYEGVRRKLRPLFLAGREGRRPLTRSGVHYVVSGSALHVADGSEIIRRRVGGPSLSINVG